MAASSETSSEIYPANTTGLLGLPVELFEQIHRELLAGTRVITREDVLARIPFIEEKDIQYRCDVLKPLSQTCRLLRRIYLPRFYEHMEACIVRGGNKQWYKYLGQRLERSSDFFMQHEGLAKFVQ